MKPAARLEINGKPASAELMARLSSITMTDEAGLRADTCEIVLDGRGNVSAPPVGTEIKLWLGYEPRPAYRGRFRVSEWCLDGPPVEITISATSADLTSKIREPRMRSFHEQTVQQIVEKVAADHGLTPLVDAEIGARLVEHIDQQTESDAGFLTRLAGRQGATFKIGAGRLVFSAKGSRQLADGTEKQVIVVKPRDVSRWSIRSAARGDYRSASAGYIDPLTRKRKAIKHGHGEPRHRDRRLYGSKAEAEAAAAANFGDLVRSIRDGEVEGPGMPSLYAEALVTLTDFGQNADGEYLAQTVRHAWSPSGYTTSATLESVGAADAE